MSRKASGKPRPAEWLWWLVVIAKFVDVRTRFADLRLNRTDGRKLFPGHSWIFGLLCGFVVLAMVNGPTLFAPRGGLVGWGLVLGAVVATRFLTQRADNGGLLARPLVQECGTALWLRRLYLTLLAVPLLIVAVFAARGLNEAVRLQEQSVLPFVLLGLVGLSGLTGALLAPRGLLSIFQWLVFLLVAAAVWLLTPGGAAREATAGAPLYRHSLVPVGVLMTLFALPFARGWVQLILNQRKTQYREAFAQQLHRTELFDPSIASNAKPLEILRAYFLAVMGTPFQLVLIPALVVVASRPTQLKSWAVGSLVVSWMLMAMVVFHPRLNSLLSVINRLFAEGASLLLSIVVVAIAAARLIGVDYVTTVLDGSARHAVIEFLIVLYAFSWLYDYFVERALIEKLLAILNESDDVPAKVPYRHHSGDFPNRPQWLQPHGGTRIAVIRDSGDPKAPWHFNIFRPLDVFREIATRSGTSSDARKRLPILAADIRFIRTVPGVLFLGLLIWCGHGLLTRPRAPHIEAAAVPASAETGFSLAKAVAAHPEMDDTRAAPLYFIAASGGGTRAAIYTMVVLEALHERGVLHRVAGISSVSGGSLGAAYFAQKRAELLNAELDGAAWKSFQATVEAPHIQNVLSGVFEWRLVRRMRLGILLKESFETYLDGERKTLDACSDLALILNTTLVGEAPSPESPPWETWTDNSGSRVVFTNVSAFTSASANHHNPGYSPDLQFVCFGEPGIELAAAASATANFPPVFSNIAIDRTDELRLVTTEEGESACTEFDVARRFWVTDGGAMDNRGVISLLLGLRAMLREWDDKKDGRLPPIRILIADASAYSNQFRQDRGLGAMGGARLNVSSKLIAGLVEDVKQLYAEKDGHFTQTMRRAAPSDTNDDGTDEPETGMEETDRNSQPRLTVHDLTMPVAIRSAVGTHWMMAESTEFSQKNWNPACQDAPVARLSGTEITDLMRQVFRDRREFSQDFEKVWAAVSDDPLPALKALIAADQREPAD